MKYTIIALLLLQPACSSSTHERPAYKPPHSVPVRWCKDNPGVCR